ncbi:hypothetical protein C2E23DRAFT_697441, partial [Lenzites betulinus]
MSTGNSTNPTRGQSAGAGLGNIVKGGFQTVQGLSNAIRGNAMDFVDSATGTGGRHAESDIGRQQTEQGINRMHTGRNAPVAGTAAENPAASATSTSTAPPPLPARNLDQGQNTSVGVQTDGPGAGGQ